MTLPPSPPITVFGAGSWGTALAIALAKKNLPVTLWCRRPEQAEALQRSRINAEYLPVAPFPESITATSDFQVAVSSHIWVLAVPSQQIRSFAAQLRPHLKPETVVCSAAKGIESHSLLTTSQVLHETLPELPQGHLGVIYGPSHAEEVGRCQPTAIVIAGFTHEIGYQIQHLFLSPNLRVYLNSDLIGVEIGGSVKNVLAIAAGMSDGLGGGDNAKAALITRGIAEIRRLGMVMGAQSQTFTGLAGMGDLIVTCMSRHSRNRWLGEQIGRGKTLAEVQAEMKMVAEGVKTTESAYQLAQRYGIEMPITESVYAILFLNKPPKEALADLMARQAKYEDWLPDTLQE